MRALRFGPRVKAGLGLVLGIMLAVTVVSGVALSVPSLVPAPTGGENIVTTTNSTATTKVIPSGTSTVVVVIPSNSTFKIYTNSSGATQITSSGTSVVVVVPNNSSSQPKPIAKQVPPSAMDVHSLVLGFLLVIVPGTVLSFSTRAWAGRRVAFLRQELQEGSEAEGGRLDSSSSSA